MDKYDAEEIIKKILLRDYDRWIKYTEETGIRRGDYQQSFYVWKEEKGFLDEDAKLIAELFA